MRLETTFVGDVARMSFPQTSLGYVERSKQAQSRVLPTDALKWDCSENE